jgi:2-polyprenyl-3-methyl-5-hydroxy-6-metoxy-1,4-benzoquinol methylase
MGMAERVCPWWLGYLLASPVRRLFEKPEEVLAPHVKGGMTAIDVGCAMGYFSLPMAELVGPSGRVLCVDLQERMIRSLRKRAFRAGLSDRIETRECSASDLGVRDLEGKVDFALTFAVVHEVPDAAGLLGQIHDTLAPGGRLLIAEPRGHVSEEAFEGTVAAAENAGLAVIDRPDIKRSRAVLLEKPFAGNES